MTRTNFHGLTDVRATEFRSTEIYTQKPTKTLTFVCWLFQLCCCFLSLFPPGNVSKTAGGETDSLG